MAKTRVMRFLGHAATFYNKIHTEEMRIQTIRDQQRAAALEEARRHPPPKQRTAAPKSKVPAIIALHKQLNAVRKEMNLLRSRNYHSRKLAMLEKRYHHIDELLMIKLKEI